MKRSFKLISFVFLTFHWSFIFYILKPWWSFARGGAFRLVYLEITFCVACIAFVLWTAGITNEEIGRDGNEEETKEDNHINRLQFVKQNETPYNSFVCQLFIITLFCNFAWPYRMRAFFHDSFTVCSIFFYKRSHFSSEEYIYI